jgi:5,10-methenyltetrahydrofolate synthetase
VNWDEVRAWRKAERARLIAARLAVPLETRAAWTERIAAQLEPILRAVDGPVSFYWPMRAEPDFRPLMRRLAADGIVIALPVVIEPKTAMRFRPWTPRAKLEPGIWNIPVPATREEVIPRLLLAPVVGFADSYRLGYGGGYFDRTLAKLGAGHSAIGVGYELAQLATIHPQPHDIRLSRIVTEAG